MQFSKTTTLDVPTVSVVQREYSIVEGSPLSISCQVDSNPPPNIINWRLVTEGKQFQSGSWSILGKQVNEFYANSWQIIGLKNSILRPFSLTFALSQLFFSAFDRFARREKSDQQAVGGFCIVSRQKPTLRVAVSVSSWASLRSRLKLLMEFN